ncbi:MAG: ECF transporter S component [Rikenellaceae bacterium]
MQNRNVTLYRLGYSDVKTYIAAAAFVAGNILAPQLCHLIPRGGLMLLPIYLFTLIGAYKYGWKVGLLTALLSPLLNHLLFGMPPQAVLPIILVKSVLLALAAGFAAQYFKRATLSVFLLVVVIYQGVGTLAEWAMVGDFMPALQDIRVGFPGLLIQVFGGYLVVNKLLVK